MIDLAADLALIRDAVLQAGAIATAQREAGLRVEAKPGGSPVTSGDLAVEAFLKERLLSARPDYGWLSEETPDTSVRLERERIFIVDPIDGTVAYMKRQPWWCVPIAIVEKGEVVCAVIHAPEVSETYEAVIGGGAFRNGRPIKASDAETLDDASVLGDARLIDAPYWDEPWPALRFEKRNALAYRMALVAAGAFDAALALSPRWDWDVAAGCLIAQEAGARVTDHHGRPWRFNRPDPRQASMVCAAPTLHPLILRLCRKAPLAF